MTAPPLLEVEDLSTCFRSEGRIVEAVRSISFSLEKGETLALVGESGSGKSTAAMSILQLLPYPTAFHPSGSIRLAGKELMGARDAQMQQIRGGQVALIPQEPLTALNPLQTISKQIIEAIQIHSPSIRKKQATDRTIELLELVGLRNAEARLKSLPHQLSGGQRQRVMIAMALANEPDMLIADEPTTSLDVTVQAQVLDLLQRLQQRLGMALLLITHDLDIVRKLSRRVCVMKAGQIVEENTTDQVFDNPRHPYTRELINAVPHGAPLPVADDAPPLIASDDLRVHFKSKNWLGRTRLSVKAVDGVDLCVRRGHTLGIVGESGSGKTTLGMALLRLIRSNGAIRFDDQRIDSLNFTRMRPFRRRMQIVFQDPFASLSPRMTIAQIVGEGLTVFQPKLDAKARRAAAADVLAEVDLGADLLHRYPHEFSGGQRQRIAIARAIILKPDLIVLDEPTSSLDRSVQSQIVHLLRDLQQKHGLTYLFISHDLKVVRALAHEILVMKDGRAVEHGPADAIFDNPREEYTRSLLAAAFDLAVRSPQPEPDAV